MPTVGFISPLRCPAAAVTERGVWVGRGRGGEPGTRWCRHGHKMAQVGRLPLLAQMMLYSLLLIVTSDSLHRDRLALQ